MADLEIGVRLGLVVGPWEAWRTSLRGLSPVQ